MNATGSLNQRLVAGAWGALLILFGVLSIVPGDQGSLFLFGSGIVLLGLNLGRAWSKLPASPFSTVLGVLALGLGGLGLLWPLLNLPHFEIGFVPLALLALGLYLLIPGSRRARTE